MRNSLGQKPGCSLQDSDAAGLVAPLLPLTISLDALWVALPVLFPIAWMIFAPMFLAVFNLLRIHGIGVTFLAVIIRATTALARWLATDSPIGSKLGWLKGLPAITTATRYQTASSEVQTTSSKASNHFKKI